MANPPHVLCSMSELAYNPTKMIQNDIDHTYDVELTPHNTIIQGNNLLFHIEGGSDWVDLACTYLTVDIRMTDTDGNAVDDTMAAAPINNIFHSLWSQVAVVLKNSTISHPSPNYAYRAYIENLLNFSSASKTTWMKNAGFFMDVHKKFDDATNASLAKRRRPLEDKKVYTLKGKLSTDIGAQPLLIPSHTDIKFTLTPSSQDFLIQNFVADKTFKIEIVAAKLTVRKVKLYPERVIQFEKQIAKEPIRLPISQVRVNTISISAGLTSFHQNSIFSGELPTSVVVGLVANASYTGTPNKNPFNFAHFDLSHIQLRVNDLLVPSIALQPDFSNSSYLRPYESLYQVVGKLHTDWDNGIQPEHYPYGYALYGFTLNNDSHCRHDDRKILGNVDISLKFKRPLPSTISLILYSSTDGSVIIDQHRNVLVDI